MTYGAVGRRARVKPVAAWTLAGLMGLVAAGAASGAKAADCESLKAVKIDKLTIQSAQSIPAGAYRPPGSPQAFEDLPEFCRVVAVAHPVPGSSIGIEVWLPKAGWNGRYQQVGNHGFSGVIQWGEMAPQLKRGFAVGATDDGHVIDPRFVADPRAGAFVMNWAAGNQVAVVDEAWRAVHTLSQKAKLLISGYYPDPLRASYFNGCSNGGRQGLMEAQRFPADFDGILAGGAAAYSTHGATEQMVMSLNLQKAGIQGARGAAILELAQAAETKACDSLDGVADGIINNPTRCHFDPHILVCKPGASGVDCITAAQADALAANLRPVRDPVGGRWVFGGMSPGSEFNQIRFGYHMGLAPFAVANYSSALKDPKWNPTTFDLHRDLAVLDREKGMDNMIDPDLSAFKARGGKLIQYHGWDDAAFTPAWTTLYYDHVVSSVGHGHLAAVQDFYRLFMVPGVGHCAGGPGPNGFGEEGQPGASDDPQHDAVSALMAWVEHGQAPDKLIATKFVADDPKRGVQMQRPLFPYPAEAVFNGTGDPNDPTSFHKAPSTVPRRTPAAPR